MLDVDGAGGQWPYHLVTLEGVSASGLTAAKLFGQGGSTAEPPPPPPPPPPSTGGVALVSKTYGDVLTGGSGNDTLTAGQGPDRLTGGAGADRFDFDALPWNAGRVTDFQAGVDKLDLTGLASAYTGGDVMRDLSFVSDGAGGTKVMLDADGPWGGQWPTHIVTLEGVSPTSLTRADWLF